MRARNQALDGPPLVGLTLDMLVAVQISHQCGCDLLIAVTAVALENRGKRKGHVAPACVGLALPSLFVLRQQTGLFQIEIEFFQIAGVVDDGLPLGAEADGRQISDTLQPAHVLFDRCPVDPAFTVPMPAFWPLIAPALGLLLALAAPKPS